MPLVKFSLLHMAQYKQIIYQSGHTDAAQQMANCSKCPKLKFVSNTNPRKVYQNTRFENTI